MVSPSEPIPLETPNSLDKTDRSCYSLCMASAGLVTRERILEQGLALMSRDGLAGVDETRRAAGWLSGGGSHV